MLVISDTQYQDTVGYLVSLPFVHGVVLVVRGIALAVVACALICCAAVAVSVTARALEAAAEPPWAESREVAVTRRPVAPVLHSFEQSRQANRLAWRSVLQSVPPALAGQP